MVGVILAGLLAACAAPASETVEVTRVVKEEVEVEVPVEVEKKVEVPVEVEVVVTATPAPVEAWVTLDGPWDAPPASQGNRFAPGFLWRSYWFVYEPLFHYVPVSGEILPRLAESFEESDAGFTVNLVKGAVWHDGTPVTSQDVRCSFLLRKLQNATIWKYISAVETPDDFTVFMPWQERTLFAKQFLATEPIIAPYHLYGEWCDQVPDVMDDEDAQKELLADLQEFRPEKPIGTGPFYVDEVTASDIIMPKFEDYRLASNVDFAGIRYLQSRSHEIGMAYALGGDTHTCGAPLRPDYRDALAARRSDLRVIPVTDLAEFGVGYNMRDFPYSELDVRQALTFATDREQLAQVTFPVGNPVTTYSHQVLKSMENAWLSEDFLKTLTSYAYDPAKATSLLEGAGFSKNADGNWLLPDGTPWEIEVNCPAGYGDWVLGCENLAVQYTDFGIPSVCQPLDNSVFWPKTTAGEYGVAFLWAGVHWSTAHPYTAFDRYFFGDTAMRTGFADADGHVQVEVQGPDGATIDVESLVIELGATEDANRQQEIVETLSWVSNEYLAEMVYVEKQFHFCVYEDEIAGFPPTDDGLWLLAPGGQERVWVWLMITGAISPQ
jgi:peptide/nickel transport system substrate-binding protein